MAKRLNELTTGDKVAFTSLWHPVGFGGWYYLWEPETVQKDTDTQLTVRGQRFLRRNGYKIGDTSRRPTRIVPWSEQIEKEIEETQRAIEEHEERRKLLAVIDNVRFKDLPMDTLRAVVDILKPESAGGE